MVMKRAKPENFPGEAAMLVVIGVSLLLDFALASLQACSQVALVSEPRQARCYGQSEVGQSPVSHSAGL